MNKRRQLVALILLASAAGPCSADIYAFLDEHGVAHFSDVQLDSRYQLYMKTRPPAEPQPLVEAVTPPATVASAETAAAAFVRPIPLQTSKRYADMIARVAREQKIEPALLHAVIAVESAYNPHAKSPKGATGLMQLMPDTARRYGVTDLLNPLENLRAGARYLRDLLGMFNNNLRLVLAAYNAGEGAVIRSGHAIPPYPETRAYVPRVLQHYEHYRARNQPS
jgi:soluble lytic murein transglycosylase-like protein